MLNSNKGRSRDFVDDTHLFSRVTTTGRRRSVMTVEDAWVVG